MAQALKERRLGEYHSVEGLYLVGASRTLLEDQFRNNRGTQEWSKTSYSVGVMAVILYMVGVGLTVPGLWQLWVGQPLGEQRLRGRGN